MASKNYLFRVIGRAWWMLDGAELQRGSDWSLFNLHHGGKKTKFGCHVTEHKTAKFYMAKIVLASSLAEFVKNVRDPTNSQCHNVLTQFDGNFFCQGLAEPCWPPKEAQHCWPNQCVIGKVHPCTLGRMWLSSWRYVQWTMFYRYRRDRYWLII